MSILNKFRKRPEFRGIPGLEDPPVAPPLDPIEKDADAYLNKILDAGLAKDGLRITAVAWIDGSNVLLTPDALRLSVKEELEHLAQQEGLEVRFLNVYVEVLG